MNPKILIIDDEQPIRRFLDTSLSSQGFEVYKAKNGKEGLQMAIDHRVDLIVLDLNLPDLQGIDVLKKLRSYSAVPVIVLTAKSDDAEKVLLLDEGADDYLTKPFSVPELLARIRVALRHATPPSAEKPFTYQELKIDFKTHQVFINQQVVKLTGTEFALLKMLAIHAGKMITQKQLLQEIWGPTSTEQTHYLRIYIGQLRKKIEITPTLKGLIITEPGVGYRLKQD